MLTVPPYPFVLDDPSEVPLEACGHARPQLFFNCYMRPAGGRLPKKANNTYGTDNILVDLIFFSTFEDLDLSCFCPMEANQVHKLYEPLPTPVLYVGPVNNLLGRLPLETLHQPSHINSVTSSTANFHTAVQMLSTSQARREATSTRWTNGYGSLRGQTSPGGSVSNGDRGAAKHGEGSLRKDGAARAVSTKARMSSKAAPKAAVVQWVTHGVGSDDIIQDWRSFV